MVLSSSGVEGTVLQCKYPLVTVTINCCNDWWVLRLSGWLSVTVAAMRL
jgi:hypothetical protein